MTEHAPDLDATHARQARRGRHAFVILVVSLTAAIAVVFGAWAGDRTNIFRPSGEPTFR